MVFVVWLRSCCIIMVDIGFGVVLVNVFRSALLIVVIRCDRCCRLLWIRFCDGLVMLLERLLMVKVFLLIRVSFFLLFMFGIECAEVLRGVGIWLVCLFDLVVNFFWDVVRFCDFVCGVLFF